MKKFVLCLLALSTIATLPSYSDGLLKYVNTYIGTTASYKVSDSVYGREAAEGNGFPAVFVPQGMNFWTAQTRAAERKCVSPYYYEDEKLQGFRASHWIQGSCTQDFGSVTVMPLSGSLRLFEEDRAVPFSHDAEVSTPAYYQVSLPSEGIKAEMTGYSRAGILRFTYSSAGTAYIVVTPNSDEDQGEIIIDTEKWQVRGRNPIHRIYQGKGLPAGHSGWFVIQFDRPFEVYGTYHSQEGVAVAKESNPADSDKHRLGAYVGFKVAEGEKVQVKVSTSFCDLEGAAANMAAELPGWDFDAVKANLIDIWNRHLGKIQLTTRDEENKTEFYSAMYRASFLPHAISDVDGRYPAFADNKTIMKMKDGMEYYDDYSMWDTYRAEHPLLTILAPSKSADMMQSLLSKYQQGGWLPIFPCWNSYTSEMIGDHCLSVLSEAYMKGIEGIDYGLAYEAMRKNAFETPDSYDDYKDGKGRRALEDYINLGYVPLDNPVNEAYHRAEQSSRTLEYAYDDYALALVAKAMGKTDDYNKLITRSKNYRNVIDPASGWLSGRYADGRFIDQPDPTLRLSYICEGTPCHYTWYVPHDVPGLIEAMGGLESFNRKLDSMFTEKLYWHGNEPCHQVAFMFDYSGKAWRTQEVVRHVLETEYYNSPGGLCGNDDAGQMSAWYIFASLGFYPVSPVDAEYALASPVFDKAVINLENGKQFKVIARGNPSQNIYVRSVRVNGRKLKTPFLKHEDIVKGGRIVFRMSSKPNKKLFSKI